MNKRKENYKKLTKWYIDKLFELGIPKIVIDGQIVKFKSDLNCFFGETHEIDTKKNKGMNV